MLKLFADLKIASSLDDLSWLMYTEITDGKLRGDYFNVQLAKETQTFFEMLEDESRFFLDTERRMMGVSGAMERAGVQQIYPIVNLPGDMLGAKTKERIARLSLQLSTKGASIAAGILAASPDQVKDTMVKKFGTHNSSGGGEG